MNKAAKLGPCMFPWWPDWRGECAAIIACGPSAKELPIDRLKDRIHVIAIKESFELCRWADVVYGCDAAWWKHRKGLPEFNGIKIYHGIQAKGTHPDMQRVEIKLETDALLVEQPMVIGNGGNSGQQALNLAVQFGATDIILVGFDMSAHPNHLHWYGRNTWLNASNPMGSNFNRWKKGFEIAKKDADRLRLTIVNASPRSDLGCFRKAGLEETLEAWGL